MLFVVCVTACCLSLHRHVQNRHAEEIRKNVTAMFLTDQKPTVDFHEEGSSHWVGSVQARLIERRRSLSPVARKQGWKTTIASWAKAASVDSVVVKRDQIDDNLLEMLKREQELRIVVVEDSTVNYRLNGDGKGDELKNLESALPNVKIIAGKELR